ncbi:MAG: flagellar hook-associated protein FlgK [Desulfonatronovibrio sp. MSAO_Bac4]|nr:MAG: flagellar hook-associated protein FlgK [Desulfonatronovibrio sp. MSAO_Bac4]
MSGISSVLDIGRRALFANQTAIQVVSNNVANANTPGYRRQALRLEEAGAIDFAPGQIGTGVNAKEVYRYFDSFIESQYNTKSSEREMWDTLHSNLSNVEILFNESMGKGLNDVLSGFWSDWQDLSKRPDDTNVRAALIGNTLNLTSTINRLNADIEAMQKQSEDFVRQDVARANEIFREISEINKEINIKEIPGRNNLNEMRDKRDLLVRELAEIIDINYIDNGGGNVTITTNAGHTLVDGQNYFKLAFESQKTFADLSPGSNFDGAIYYEGSSNYELTVKVVHEGAGIDDPTDPTRIKVSLDGGRTWIKDENGKDEFAANTYDNRITLPVDGIKLWFGEKDDPTGTNLQNLSLNDEFVIVPKSGLYWYENTSSAMNITPQIFGSGQMNDRRITGGSLAGYLNFRDHYAGKYKEKLDATASSLAWEVNRIHSQGAGLEKLTQVTGTSQVVNKDTALGTSASGLHFGDKLQAGNLSFYVYDKATGEMQESRLDFGGGNFDPSVHTLEDVKNAIDSISNINASIINNRLHIESEDSHEFALGKDTSGLLAALGVNTFFQGEGAKTIAANEFVRNNIAYINAGHVNGAGEANEGDNTTALEIAALQHKKVPITTSFEGTTNQTIQDYYNSLVGNVGADTSMTKFSAEYNRALSNDLNRKQEEISGVNMDEEMSNLIKFQHSYQAAAKLITTADRMLQVLMGMKN